MRNEEASIRSFLGLGEDDRLVDGNGTPIPPPIEPPKRRSQPRDKVTEEELAQISGAETLNTLRGGVDAQRTQLIRNYGLTLANLKDRQSLEGLLERCRELRQIFGEFVESRGMSDAELLADEAELEGFAFFVGVPVSDHKDQETLGPALPVLGLSTESLSGPLLPNYRQLDDTFDSSTPSEVEGADVVGPLALNAKPKAYLGDVR